MIRHPCNFPHLMSTVALSPMMNRRNHLELVRKLRAIPKPTHVRSSVRLSVCLSVCLSVFLSFCLSCLSVCLFVCLSVCLSVCLKPKFDQLFCVPLNLRGPRSGPPSASSSNFVFYQPNFSQKCFGFRQDRTDGRTDRQTYGQTDAISIFWAFLLLRN